MRAEAAVLTTVLAPLLGRPGSVLKRRTMRARDEEMRLVVERVLVAGRRIGGAC